MCIKYSLVFPRGVNGHIEVGIVGKLDLQDLRFFLGHDDIRLSYIQDGRLVTQLPILHSEFFNPLGDLRVELILAYCQSPVLSTSFLKKTLAGLVGTQPLEWWLENLQSA